MQISEMENCTYCGLEPGKERDHLIPRSYSLNRRNYWIGEMVPACRECNAMLSDKILPTVDLRAAYLAEKLKERHRKTLRFPSWTEEELSDMSPTMAGRIKEQMMMKKIIKARIANCEAMAEVRLHQKKAAA